MISVIIPVRNGEKTLEKCLSAISRQTVADEIEIIILDSCSTDKSVEIAIKYTGRVINIAEGTFNHGLTRNIGLKEAKGELIFFTVQDAWLADENMLEQMAAHFCDSNVKAVCGHQAVPHEKDKNPLLWFKRFSKHVVERRYIRDIKEFESFSPKKQVSLLAWDNVAAMYRKSALSDQPFAATEFAEDYIWSFNALLKGWALIYDPSSVVYHYHHRSYSYSYKVAYTINYHFYHFFNHVPELPPLLMPMVKATWHLLKNHHLNFKEKIYWISHNYAWSIATFFSHLNFLYHLKLKGEGGITEGYNKICKNIPQGLQKQK